MEEHKEKDYNFAYEILVSCGLACRPNIDQFEYVIFVLWENAFRWRWYDWKN